jgi:hypothetical protein
MRSAQDIYKTDMRDEVVLETGEEDVTSALQM